MPFGFDSGATLSPCRRYRYRLWRSWGPREHRVVFVGLNPSTADETKDDPTIRKCIGFAKRWGFGALDMVNLFAWRSTSPSGLLTASDPIGPENDEAIQRACDDAHRVVWAWGRHNSAVRRMVTDRRTKAPWLVLRRHCETGTLGRAQDGSPRHPLMLPYSTRWEENRNG